MKNERQNKILKLVSENSVSTQEELRDRLIQAGYNVTQTTVSRDIKELALIKAADKDGVLRYHVPALRRKSMEGDGITLSMLCESIRNVDHALNTVAVKCRAGMAQAVCAELDTFELSGVVGTLAGEDTIFILMRTEKDAQRLVKELQNTIDNRR